MFIVPLSQLPAISPMGEDTLAKAAPQPAVSGAPFVDIFKEAFQNMQETRAVADEDSVKLALGQMDNLHLAQINASKASVATDFAVGLASRALTAYNEIIRMQV